jgi:hypothetical protein
VEIGVDLMASIVDHVFFLEHNNSGPGWFSLEHGDGGPAIFSLYPTCVLNPVPANVRNICSFILQLRSVYVFCSFVEIIS